MSLVFFARSHAPISHLSVSNYGWVGRGLLIGEKPFDAAQAAGIGHGKRGSVFVPEARGTRVVEHDKPRTFGRGSASHRDHSDSSVTRLAQRRRPFWYRTEELFDISSKMQNFFSTGPHGIVIMSLPYWKLAFGISLEAFRRLHADTRFSTSVALLGTVVPVEVDAALLVTHWHTFLQDRTPSER